MLIFRGVGCLRPVNRLNQLTTTSYDHEFAMFIPFFLVGFFNITLALEGVDDDGSNFHLFECDVFLK